MNFSAMPCARRGGFISKNIEARTSVPSSATPPEWLPTSMARPCGGTWTGPWVSTEKYRRQKNPSTEKATARCFLETP